MYNVRTLDDGVRLSKNPKTGKWERIDNFSFRGVHYVAMPWHWLEICAPLPGKALAVAALICLQKDLKQSPTVTLPRAALLRCKIGRAALHRAIINLQKAGLISFTHDPGTKSKITIVDPEGRMSVAGKTARQKIRMVVNHGWEDEEDKP